MLADLPSAWRTRAEELRPYSAPAAEAWSRAADELQEALGAAEQEQLAPADAARESGLSERRLRELVVEGKLANVGRRGAPRYRRADLPRRAGRGTGSGWDPSAHVDAIAGRAS